MRTSVKSILLLAAVMTVTLTSCELDEWCEKTEFEDEETWGDWDPADPWATDSIDTLDWDTVAQALVVAPGSAWKIKSEALRFDGYGEEKVGLPDFYKDDLLILGENGVLEIKTGGDSRTPDQTDLVGTWELTQKYIKGPPEWGVATVWLLTLVTENGYAQTLDICGLDENELEVVYHEASNPYLALEGDTPDCGVMFTLCKTAMTDDNVVKRR